MCVRLRRRLLARRGRGRISLRSVNTREHMRAVDRLTLARRSLELPRLNLSLQEVRRSIPIELDPRRSRPWDSTLQSPNDMPRCAFQCSLDQLPSVIPPACPPSFFQIRRVCVLVIRVIDGIVIWLLWESTNSLFDVERIALLIGIILRALHVVLFHGISSLSQASETLVVVSMRLVERADAGVVRDIVAVVGFILGRILRRGGRLTQAHDAKLTCCRFTDIYIHLGHPVG